MSPKVLVIVTDLLFQARISDALRALNTQPAIIESQDALSHALGDAPAAAVIDLHERELDALNAVAVLYAASVPVLAFGRHTEPALLRAAREAGATASVARSQLVDELPELLRALLSDTSASP